MRRRPGRRVSCASRPHPLRPERPARVDHQSYPTLCPLRVVVGPRLADAPRAHESYARLDLRIRQRRRRVHRLIDARRSPSLDIEVGTTFAAFRTICHRTLGIELLLVVRCARSPTTRLVDFTLTAVIPRNGPEDFSPRPRRAPRRVGCLLNEARMRRIPLDSPVTTPSSPGSDIFLDDSPVPPHPSFRKGSSTYTVPTSFAQRHLPHRGRLEESN